MFPQIRRPLRLVSTIFSLLSLVVLLLLVSRAVAADVKSDHSTEVVAATVAPARQTEGAIQDAWRKAISNDRTEELIALWNQSVSQEGRKAEKVRKALLDTRTANGKNAFMIACKTGHRDFFETLLDAGADPQSRTATGGTPLMFAVLGDHRDIAARLLSLGADANAQGSNGWTAMTIAAAKGYTQSIVQLASAGADANIPDVYRWSPLMRTVDNGHLDTLLEMLKIPGINLQQQDESGNTALHYAVAHQHEAMIDALLRADADVEAANHAGVSAQAMAVADGVPDSIASRFRQ